MFKELYKVQLTKNSKGNFVMNFYENDNESYLSINSEASVKGSVINNFNDDFEFLREFRKAFVSLRGLLEQQNINLVLPKKLGMISNSSKLIESLHNTYGLVDLLGKSNELNVKIDNKKIRFSLSDDGKVILDRKIYLSTITDALARWSTDINLGRTDWFCDNHSKELIK